MSGLPRSLWLLPLAVLACVPAPAADAPGPKQLLIAGDSTAANNGAEGPVGWGVVFQEYFDPSKIQVVNLAKGGRSSRTFYSEGLWQMLEEKIHPGDIVLIQFGHNDSGPVNDTFRARGSLAGLGDESQEIDNMLTKKHEVVHSFGWYMRYFVERTKARGGVPIVVSPTIRNIWTDKTVEHTMGHFRDWSQSVAEQEQVAYVDLSGYSAVAIEKLGPAVMAGFYPKDHTHTNHDGAEFNATWTLAGLKTLPNDPLDGTFSEKGQAVPAAAALPKGA